MSHLKINRDFTLDGVSYVGGNVVLEKGFPAGSVEGCKRVGHVSTATPPEIKESEAAQVALAEAEAKARAEARAKSEAEAKARAKSEKAEKEKAEKEK